MATERNARREAIRRAGEALAEALTRIESTKNTGWPNFGAKPTETAPARAPLTRVAPRG